MSDSQRRSAHRPAIRPDRIRRVEGGFAFIPNRFLHDGFLASLSHTERSLYLFFILAADRYGVSFYAHDRICATLEIATDDYLQARAGLIQKDLIAFDGATFQVLSLPPSPILQSRPALTTTDDFEQHDSATIRQIIRSSLSPRR
jgi:hypothetical protein